MTAFFKSHQLTHPGRNGVAKLANQRFLRPGIKQDCREWTSTLKSSKSHCQMVTNTALCALADIHFGQKHTQ